jgi:hypothetical protein
MRADDVQAGHRFFWEQVGVAMRMTRMRFDTDDHIDLPRTSGYEFVTGRVEGRDLTLGSYRQRGDKEDFPYSAVLASIDGLPDEVEVSINLLGAVSTGRPSGSGLAAPVRKTRSLQPLHRQRKWEVLNC